MKKIFDEEWHPLYGNLPPYIAAPKSQAARCINIIQDARKIWQEDIKDWSGILNDIIAAHEAQRKELEEKPGYKNPNFEEIWHDAKAVSDRLAWAIYCECIHIYQHSVLDDAPECYYRKENGKVDTKHSLDTVWEKAVHFVRTYLDRWGFCGEGVERIPDYAFLSIIAIYEAHSVLQSIYEYKESDEDVFLIEDVQIATSIMLQTERLRSEALTSHIVNIRPLAEAMIQNLSSLCSVSQGEALKPSSKDASDEGFKHNPDYTRVFLKGKEYDLPYDKGKLIKVLHEAYKNGCPVLSKKDAMEKAGLKGRFTDLFKTARELKQALIVEENNGRSCRLNI